MDADERIARFEQMTKSDPDSDLGHFSLGKAYLDAGRFDEAAGSFARVIEINPNMSKSYQLLGEAYRSAGQSDQAIEALTRGVTVADGRGDLMPRDAMVAALRELGAPVPKLSGDRPEPSVVAESGAVAESGDFHCSRCGCPAGKLDKQPFKGDLGGLILAHACTRCWQEWVSMGTKVVNELGLQLANQAGQDVYDQHMIEFLQLPSR